MTWFELDLTQRREGARTQRAVANDSLRPSGFADLRLCVNFMLCSKHYLKQVLRHVKSVSLGAKGDDAA